MDINQYFFLQSGFFIDYDQKKFNFDFSRIDKAKYIGKSEDELIQIGKDKLIRSIKKFIRNKEVLLPLSGGLDSRVLLAGLMEYGSVDNISTYTFGIPGSFDFEIGNFLANRFETNHKMYSLKNYHFTEEEEMVIAERFDYQTHLFLHPPYSKIEEDFNTVEVWSGFLGGEIGGSHVKRNPSGNLEEALDFFMKKNRSIGPNPIKPINKDAIKKWVKYDEKLLNTVAIDDQLDFLNRQTKYIIPHVLIKGFQYVTPFFNTEFFDFMMSLDHKYRYRKSLYKKILLETYPKYFKLPTSECQGRQLNNSRFLFYFDILKKKLLPKPTINRSTNYFDIDDEIRKNLSLKKIIKNKIIKINKRKIIESNLEPLLEKHLTNKNNWGMLLILLSSLEIILNDS